MSRPLDPEYVEEFRRIIARRMGLQFDNSRLGFLEQVLRARLDANRRPLAGYLAALDSEPAAGEVRALAQELTVGETYFFRNIAQFEALAEIALPDRMRAQHPRTRLQLLSAGCASGEEAFSLAIAVRRAIADPSWQVSIRAVDINRAALEKAARGRFSRWALRETPADVQAGYFRIDGSSFLLDEAARAAVTFDERNLTRDDPELWQPGAYDVIFCRNTLMYFTPAQAQALVARLTRSLAPGGYLFLGHAETLRGLSYDYELRHTHGTFYYQRRYHLERTPPSGPSTRKPAPAGPAGLVETSDIDDGWAEIVGKAAGRIETLAVPRAAAPSTGIAGSRRANLRVPLDLLADGRTPEALALLHQLAPESHDERDVMLLKALLLADGGDPALAEPLSRQLLAIDPLNAGAHYVLGLCRESADDREGAADHHRMAAYLDLSFAMPRLHLGLLARRRGDCETARRELAEAMFLLQRGDASETLFFGSGFSRASLMALCRAELDACGASP